jgi:hypothetical protein
MVAAAGLVPCWPKLASAQTPPDPRLLRAIARHMSYSVGFRRKFGTTIYVPPGQDASPAQAMMQYQRILQRLRSATDRAPTLALIHFYNTDQHLDAWLLDGNGIVAHGSSAGPYGGLQPLFDVMRVDARTATRSPRLRGQARMPPAPPAPPRDPQAELARTAQELLPGAVGEALAAREGRLLILPARDSGSAPYATLPLGEGMVADRWSTVILPDIDTLADPMRVFNAGQLNPRNALLLGDPDLSSDPIYDWTAIPETLGEVQDFAEAFGIPPSRLLTGKDATRARLLAAIDNYGEASIVYVATHGVANSVNPMDGSFLALSGGHLFGKDLRGTQLQAWAAWHPLVILSACQTALGKTFDGGTFGIARGWVAAGAGQVVASLWNVSDAATRKLMSRFAHHAFTERQLPEEALRLAQLDIRDLYATDPAAWASFSVLGAPAA